MRYTQHQGPVFLADDDEDDRYLFEYAFSEVAKNTNLVMAADGSDLMNLLEQTIPPPPQVIFLDLNMPRKSGLECLMEIRKDDSLSEVPVVVFSTSCEPEDINRAFENGANLYFCKPNSFPGLKEGISRVLAMNWHDQPNQPAKEQFVLAC